MNIPSPPLLSHDDLRTLVSECVNQAITDPAERAEACSVLLDKLSREPRDSAEETRRHIFSLLRIWFN
jgi:hypothetical protein